MPAETGKADAGHEAGRVAAGASARAVRALLHDYRRYAGTHLWGLLALMLLASLAEGIGILMLVPLVTAATASGGSMPPILDGLTSLTADIPAERRLLLALAAFVAAMGVRSLLTFARDLAAARLQTGYEASLRIRAASALSRRGWTFAARIGQAGMQSLLLTEIPRASSAVVQAQQFAIAATMLCVQFAIAATLSIELTLVAAGIFALALLASLHWNRRGFRSGLAIVRRAEESAGSGFRLHAGLKSALAQGTVAQFLGEYRTTLDRSRDDQVRFARDIAMSRTLGFFASAVTAALLFYVGYGLLGLAFPVLITSLILFARISGPAQQLQQAAQRIAGYAPSFAAIVERLGPLEPVAVAAGSARPLDWRELRLDGVRFEHSAGLGLRGVDLELRSGEWLGVTGASGAGKTTLVDVIAGLVAPQSGALTVDGAPLAGERLDQWRAGLAYVGQEGSVFDDSVRGNLTSDCAGADDAQLWSALESVGLADRVRAFDLGLDQRVGDRGSALSGGERQRLGIARALLRRPTLLILDEATAALDPASEAALMDSVRVLRPRPAAILIAHRESTLAHCDLQVRVQHGGVNAVKRGSGADE